jgi:hypothetical protein
MMHAKKMMLINPENVEKLKTLTQNESAGLNALDMEMHKVLKRKDISDQDKWRLYEQILQKFVMSAQQLKQPIRISLYDVESDRKDVDNGEVDGTSNDNFNVNIPGEILLSNEILQSMGSNKVLIRKAKTLLDMLERSNLIHWNERGEISVHGQLVPGTNIVDLVNDVLKSRKMNPPIGWEPFTHVLYEMNIPREYVGNPDRWTRIRQLQTSSNRNNTRSGSRALPLPPPVTRPSSVTRPPTAARPQPAARPPPVAHAFRSPPAVQPPSGDSHIVHQQYDIPLEPEITDDESLEDSTVVYSKKGKEDEKLSKFYSAFRKGKNKSKFKLKRLGKLIGVKKLNNEGKDVSVAQPANDRRAQKRKSDENRVFDPLLWMEPVKRRRRQRIEGVAYTLRGRKRKRDPPISKRTKIYIRENPIIRGLDERSNRKRRVVTDNWWNDKRQTIPRKKAKLEKILKKKPPVRRKKWVSFKL